MNKKIMLIGFLVFSFAIGTVLGAVETPVEWNDRWWGATFGVAVSSDTTDDGILDRLEITAESDSSAKNYRGTVKYNLFMDPPLVNPLYSFSFERPVDDISIQVTFTGSSFDFLFFEVNNDHYRYLARDPAGHDFAGLISMPPELWAADTHDVSFGIREDGNVDLLVDDWKKMTIRDPDFAAPGIFGLDAAIDVISVSAGQTAAFTDYDFSDGYTYSGTPPRITSTAYPPSIDEGPSPPNVELTAFFEDDEGWDTFNATIDWGDMSLPMDIPWEDFDFTPNYSTLGGSGSVTASHIYPNDGTYNGLITITDVEGESDSESFTVVVNEVPPTVDFSWSAEETPPGYTVTLTPDVIVDPDGLDRHEWRKDGESTPFAVTTIDTPVTISFPDTTDHIITLTTYDGDGNSGSDTGTVKPLFPIAEVRDIAPSPLNEGETVTIQVGLVDDLFSIKSVNWVVNGDSFKTIEPSTTYTFSDDGEYDFTATINMLKSTASVTDTITVLDVPLVVTITEPESPASISIGDELHATWHITDPGDDGPWTYEWKDNSDAIVDHNDLGTITSGVSYTSRLLIQNPATSEITLIITDNKGAVSTTTLLISINAEPALTLTGPTTVNINQPAEFTAEILSPGITYVDEIEWTIDGVISSYKPSSKTVTESASFTTTGIYTITVTIATKFEAFTTASHEITVEDIPIPETPFELKQAAKVMFAGTHEDMSFELDDLGKKGKKIEKAFDSALETIEKSIDPKYWTDDGTLLLPKVGKKVFDAEKHAVDKIQDLIKFWEKEELGTGLVDTWTEVIDTLVEADLLIAENDLADAKLLAGEDPDKKIAKHLDKSQDFIDRAEDELKPSHAITLYKDAWEHSQAAKKAIK